MLKILKGLFILLNTISCFWETSIIRTNNLSWHRADTVSFGTSFRYRWGKSFRKTKLKFRRASDVHSVSANYRRQILIRRESSQSLFNVDEDGKFHS